MTELESREVRSRRVLRRLRRAIGWVFRPIRVRLAKLLDPGPPPDDQFDFLIMEPLACASELRSTLQIDESTYLTVAGQSIADARAYVIYTALDEVQKTSMWLMRMREFVQPDSFNPRAGYAERLLHTQLLEERDGRTRRLLEVLVTLVLFGSSNEQPYYRHLLALELLDGELSSRTDVTEFWGAPIANLEFSIEHQIAVIKQIEREVQIEKCWYLAERRPLRKAGGLRPGRLLSSARERIKAALPLMTDGEKLLFGFTYGASYGRTSESIHYSTDRHDWKLSDDDDVTGKGHLALLSLNVLVRSQALLPAKSETRINRLARILEKTDASSLAARATQVPINVGDFVLASGDLGEVIEVTESKYGYNSYRVRFLAERPIPGIDEDWFPALYVQPFYDRAQFISNIRERVAKGDFPMDVAQKMEEVAAPELRRILGASIANVWNLGLREWVRSSQAARRSERKRPNWLGE